ncbi:hypothetical protein SLEP1_g14734 [Rubroshorea leprosula]|uniref:PAP/OAS1 substrate-binding-related domain-containing protein n=1 Tax=Rubroshorea leprosula TaxID=152421 RepID=A0AAV5IU19_9ROSI|nr:hypothetical protein SLEP1_g14734 [Rubroshorea leprosula]
MGDLRDWSPELNGGIVRSNESVCGTTRLLINISRTRMYAFIGKEVFPFGSVPLKTYLPDGDIDLTAFGGLNVEDALANDLCSVLEFEEQNSDAEFVVKDVQFIRAEVKLVKCLVQNIVVDISFNQLGGLCTLCFLEKVDRLIGKDNLFKRSIILIKAWCYYESRILGAHHGLIATYALETLVLYIFHFFHSSLDGPLVVLYKFLDYFSKFDWDNYCISLNGPIRISSLPEVLVETPENGGVDLLLSNDFLKDCLERFSVPSKGFETNLRTFPQKHLNIVDPLKENNNLGRSVSKGNFYRIRSAFIYGARKLRHILSQAEENIGEELHKFFQNTWVRHGSGQRPDVPDSVPMTGYSGLTATPPISGPQSCQEDQMVYEAESSNPSSVPENFMQDHDSLLGVNNGDQSRRETSYSKSLNEQKNSASGSAVSENHLSGDAEDLATYRIQGLVISNDTPKVSIPNAEGSSNGIVERKQSANSYLTEKKVSSSILPASGRKMCVSEIDDQAGNKSTVNQEVLSPGRSRHHSSSVYYTRSSEDIYRGFSGYTSSVITCGNHEASDSLSDLCGDNDSQLNSLQFGRWFYDSVLSAPVSPVSSSKLLQSKNSWDLVRQAMLFSRSMVPPMNANGIVPRPVYPPLRTQLLHGAGFGIEDMPKQRGIGTYFPNMNHYRDKSLPARGRNQAPVRSPRNNGCPITYRESNSPERSSHELSPVYSIAHQGASRSGASDLRHSASADKMFYSNANGSMHHPDRVVEFRQVGHVPPATPTPDSSKQSNLGSPHAPNSSTVHSTPGTKRPDRMTIQSYRLKDDEDFPPLSV